MSRRSDSKELRIFSKPPLLMTESAKDFASLSAALAQDINPRGMVERIYVDEIAALVWEILRLRRCKAAMVNTAFEDALTYLLKELAHVDQDTLSGLVTDWFAEPEAAGEVSELLAQWHLDETAIEARAIQSVSKELEVLDRMLTSLEARRNRTLRCISDHRQTFAKQIELSTDRILENDEVPRLVAVRKRSE